MPIACQLYSELEIAAMRHQTVELKTATESLYSGKVKTLTVRESKEYLVTPEDELIPLDDVISVEVK